MILHNMDENNLYKEIYLYSAQVPSGSSDNPNDLDLIDQQYHVVSDIIHYLAHLEMVYEEKFIMKYNVCLDSSSVDL